MAPNPNQALDKSHTNTQTTSDDIITPNTVVPPPAFYMLTRCMLCIHAYHIQPDPTFRKIFNLQLFWLEICAGIKIHGKMTSGDSKKRLDKASVQTGADKGNPTM